MQCPKLEHQEDGPLTKMHEGRDQIPPLHPPTILRSFTVGRSNPPAKEATTPIFAASSAACQQYCGRLHCYRGIVVRAHCSNSTSIAVRVFRSSPREEYALFASTIASVAILEPPRCADLHTNRIPSAAPTFFQPSLLPSSLLSPTHTIRTVDKPQAETTCVDSSRLPNLRDSTSRRRRATSSPLHSFNLHSIRSRSKRPRSFFRPGRVKADDIRPEQKWDFISLNDFKNTGCFAPFAYGYLWASLIVSIAVYGIDTFTAVNLLAFDKWSGAIQPKISFDISKWIFSVCIILSWVNLGFEHIRAMRVIRRGAVVESFLDSLAVRLQCVRLGEGRGWRRFLVFAELTKSKKGAEYVALFTYFSFQAWIRIIFCQGPRQVVNAVTLYAVFQAKFESENDVGSTLLQFFKNIGLLAQENHMQAVVLSGMTFTLIIWVFGALSLLLAVLFYIFFLWHYIPNADGGLTGYCERKVSKRLSQIVSVKVNKALEEEERRRMRADVKALKKGEKPQFGRQATLPTLFDQKSDDKLPQMPSLQRNDTTTTLPLYSSRPGTPSGQPTLPAFELDSLSANRPVPSRNITGSSFASNAPLMGNASDMGYGRSASPAPSLPPLDTNGYPAQPQRTMTSSSNGSQWNVQQGPPRMPSAMADRGFTESPVSYSDGRNTPVSQTSVNTFGRPMPRAVGELRSNTPAGPAPSIGRRTPFDPNMNGRASPALSDYGRNSPAPMRGNTPANGGYQTYNPNVRSPSTAPTSFPSGGPGPQYRNMTDPGYRGPSDEFANGPVRPNTAQSSRSGNGIARLASPAPYNNGGSPGLPPMGLNSVLSLLGTCLKVGLALKDFYDAAAFADTKVKGLLTDVESFTTVLQLMKDTLEEEKIQTSFQATGHIGNHWSNLATSIQDGQNTLLQLQETLEKVNKSVKVLDGARKHMRLKGASEEIILYQQQIRSYRDTLQLSLQTMESGNPPHCLRYQQPDKQFTEMQSESNSNETQIRSLGNLRSCVQSAASVVSSASTTLGVAHSDHFSVTYGSEFGDVFPSEPGETMLRWISSNTVYEFEEGPDADPESKGRGSPSRNKFQAVDEVSLSEQSDSDADLEVEMFQALLKLGKEKLEGNDFDSAERLFRNCLTRTSANGSLVDLHLIPKSRLEIMRLLVSLYFAQEKWNEAQSILLEKISLGSRDKSRDKGDVLTDMLTLVDVLLHKNAYAEALLYGRRAFKGYRKMGPEGRGGVERSLRAIVRTCHLDGNYDEEDAYAAILSDFLRQNPSKVALDESADFSFTPRSIVRYGIVTAKTADVDTSGDGSPDPNLDVINAVEKPENLDSRPQAKLSFETVDDTKGENKFKGSDFGNQRKEKIASQGGNSLLVQPVPEVSVSQKRVSITQEPVNLVGDFRQEAYEPPWFEHAPVYDSLSPLSVSQPPASDWVRNKRDKLNPTAVIRGALENVSMAPADGIPHSTSSTNTNNLLSRQSSSRDYFQAPASRQVLERSKSAQNLGFTGEASSRPFMVEMHYDQYNDFTNTPTPAVDHSASAILPVPNLSSQNSTGRSHQISEVLTPAAFIDSFSIKSHISPPMSLHRSRSESILSDVDVVATYEKTLEAERHKEPSESSLSDMDVVAAYEKRLKAQKQKEPSESSLSDLNIMLTYEKTLKVEKEKQKDQRGKSRQKDQKENKSRWRLSRRAQDVLPKKKTTQASKSTASSSSLASFFGPYEIRRKLVIVGDTAIGKSPLLIVFLTGTYSELGYNPTVSENYVGDVAVDGRHIELGLWDTSGMDEFDRLRPVSYSESHVILISFAINYPNSLDSVQEKWISEVMHFCAGMPIILVGLKKDLRNDRKTIDELKKDGQHPVTYEEEKEGIEKVVRVVGGASGSGLLYSFHDTFPRTMILLLLGFSSAAAYLLWSVIALEINYRRASRMGIPLLRIPIDPSNIPRAIIEPHLWRFLDHYLPFLNFGTFGKYSRRGWQFLDKAELHLRYGPIWGFVTPKDVFVYVSDPEAVHEIFLRMGDFLRPVELYKLLEVYGPCISTAKWTDWQRHRKVLAAPFNQRIMKLVWDESLSQAKGMIASWTTDKGPLKSDFAKDTRSLSLNVLAATGFGKSYDFRGSTHPGTDEARSYRDALQTVLDNSIFLMLLTPKRLLSLPFLPREWRRIGRAAEDFKQYMLRMLEEEKASIAEGKADTGTLMSSFVRALENPGKEKMKEGDKVDRRGGLTRDEILGNIYVINFAGHDTTANTLAFCVLLLAAYPDIQEWVAEELRECIKDSEQDNSWEYDVLFPRLKRCRAVMLETLRLFPPILALPKITNDQPQTLQVGGKTVFIPPHTHLSPSILTLQTHPDYWDEPLTWKPSRWILSSIPPEEHGGATKTMDLPTCLRLETISTTEQSRYLPWLDGPQNCPGRRFSLVEFVAVIGYLLRDHRVQVVRKVNESFEEAQRRALACAEDCSFQTLLRMRCEKLVELVWSKV
ncbi:hypothetical protein G7Y89_g8493 [Cudoniella acicularis]|uniref:Uncharacterized protein n=1 Tax=Cudoniella acicularis TaxID=354080 RepID=A0A8H4RIR3_9HELO|nr:hypothetical protein G7Y89_g8493 [Cudoniella acicularis]